MLENSSPQLVQFDNTTKDLSMSKLYKYALLLSRPLLLFVVKLAKGLQLPKIPNIEPYVRGDFEIPGIKFKMPKLAAYGVAAAILGGILLLGKDQLFGGSINRNPADSDKTVFTVVPGQVRPNDFVTLQGQFVDTSSNPTTVKEGFYRIFAVDKMSGQASSTPIATGSLGKDVSNFSVNVSTQGYQDKTFYDAEISDNPDFT